MGNCLSLAVFYTCERSWNPYRESGALQERLKAALDFWTRLQQEDGRFSEYGDGELNLVLTAFATKLIRETLVIVANGPPIDPDLYEHVLESQRRPVRVPLTSDAL